MNMCTDNFAGKYVCEYSKCKLQAWANMVVCVNEEIVNVEAVPSLESS